MSAPRGFDPVVLVDVDGLRWLCGLDRRGRLWQDCGPGPPPRSLSLAGRQLVGPIGWIRDLRARRLARETARFFMEAVDTDVPALPKSAYASPDPEQDAADEAIRAILLRDLERCAQMSDKEQDQ